MGKDNEKGQSFARIFDPERFDKSLQIELKEKGEKVFSPAKTKAFLHKVIDLHGYTATGAETFLEAFFFTARQERVAKVSIITGKGIHSSGAAVIPDLTERKMREFQADGIISSFYWEKGEKELSGKLTVHLYRD
ncbi:MAG: Smr/MutS family protein [Thermodesulfobacteriota bacterium]